MRNLTTVFKLILFPVLFITKIIVSQKINYLLPAHIAKRWFKPAILYSFLILIPIQMQAVDIWTEDFSGQNGKGAIGSTIDIAGVNWTIDVSNTTLSDDNDWFAVVNEAFDGRDLDGVAIWESPTIDISAYENVNFSLDASKTGGTMESNDNVSVYYSIDNGTFILSDTLSDDFAAQTVTQAIGTATSLRIRVTMQNNDSQERYSFDNILVTGDVVSTGCPGAVIPNLDGTSVTATDSFNNQSIDYQESNFYHFTPAVDGEFRIDFDADNSNRDVSVRIYDGCGNLLVGDEGDGDRVLTQNVLAGHQIIAEVYRRYDSPMDYDIDFTFTVIVNESDLSITKTVDNATPTTGDIVTFTIVGTNNGPTTTDIEIVDTLPSGFNVTNISDNGKSSFDCSQTGSIITCTGSNNIDQGETVTITVVGTVAGAGTYTNSATITSTESVSDPDSTNNTASATFTAAAPPSGADLSITKTVDNATPTAGDTVTFTIVGINNGPTTTDIEIVDTLPSGFTVTDISENKSNFSCTQSGITITCNGTNDIDEDETVTISVEGTVASAGTYTNSATIASTESVSDPDSTNNTGSASFTASDGGVVIEPSECPLGADEAFRDFCLRKKITVPGNMVTIGNTILVAPDTGDGDGTNDNVCSTYTNGPYISNATNANNNYYLCEYHDDLAEGPSTSATIDTTHIPDPNNSSIEWAGLYWQAIVPDTESVTNMTIKIKNGNDAYATIGYDKLDWGEDVGYNGYISYSAFKDVTNILNNNNWLDGKYTVAGIPVHEGQIPSLGSYGAWTLVVVYRNDREKLRNFSIFDGWQRLQASTTNEAIINISGFYTPKQTPITSSASVFTAEGDRHITGDYLYATNANANDAYQALSHTTGHTFNSSIVPDDFTRTPDPLNNQGIDIQTFQLGTDGENFLETTQSSIDFKFTTTQDTFFPSLIAFNTELYAPQLCYDYAYKQFGQYFTEDNNGSFAPYIVGDGLSTSEPIVVELFIRNDEESDTDATNMVMHITDINSSQAIYVPNSAYVTPPGSVFAQAATPNPLQDIYIGTVGGKEHFSVDYSLDLVSSSINMPIKAELEYTLNLADSSGNLVPIDFITVLNENIPLCTEDNFAYYPDYSIFNVENSVLSATQKYNLPTQTANRAGDFKIVSYDENSVHTRKGASMPVAVEIIDANKYHDIKASCVEPDSSLTPRVWVLFENNATTVDFDKLIIDTAIAKGMVSDQILNSNDPIASAEEYYSFVRENAAFRVMYNTTDTGSDINLVPGTCQGQQVPPCYTVEGFSDLPGLDVGSGAGNCNQDVDGNPNSTDKIPQYCGNAGTAGLDSIQLAECMECIYGYNAKYICSRDNFAIRPESFRITLSDQEQTGTNKSFIANNDEPSKSHSSDNGDRIVSGYNYYVQMAATNHQNDNPTPGYYVSFTEDGAAGDRSFSLKWWEFTNDDTLCNDTSDHNKSVTFFNGGADLNLSNNEIGKYNLNLTDRVWTRVDWDVNYRSHQAVNASYFVNSSDCRDNDSFVPAQSSTTGAYIDDMSGCDITTSNHTNSDDNNLVYTDMPLHIFPYTFNHTGVIPAIGPYTRTNGQTFVYIDTPPTSDANDTEMSYNMNGTFSAVGYNNIRSTNFVTQCYASDVDMDLHFTYNIPEPPITPYLSYSLKDHNTTDSTVVYRPASGTDDFEVGTHNSSSTPFTIMQDEAYFARDMNGSITMDLGYNFARTYNQPLNPRFITFNDFNITYNINPTGIKADLESDFQIFGNKTLDQNVTFLYGRAKSSQYFYEDVVANNIDTPISIVVYCDQDPITCSAVYNIETVLSKTEEFDWYLSRGHVTTDNDGNITLVASTGGSVAPTDPSVVPINNSGGVNNPNVNVSATVNTRPLDVFIDFGNATNGWLIYNRDMNTIPSPFYRVRFIGVSDWAGSGDTGHVVESNSSIQQNRRLGW